MNNNQDHFNNPQQNDNGMLNQNNYINNGQPGLNVIPTNNTEYKNEVDDMITIQNQNKFINNNIDVTSTTLNNLNIDGSYNNMPKVDYSQEPKVKENMQKKNTVTITSEGKVFLIIIAVLLIFIFILPTVFDLITNIN